MADYSPKELYEMVIKADKIVYGEVISFDSNYYFLKISGSLTNDTGIIKVRRFENWTCAHRWANYEVCQKLLLFLVFRNQE